MKYEDMTFTEKDTIKLKENRDSICDWITNNILPKLSKDERIIIDFGGEYLGLRSYETTQNYHFSVFGSENTFYTGGGTKTRGQIAVGFKYSIIEHAFDSVNNPYKIFPFVDNWKMLKEKLLTEIEKREQNKAAIYSFEV